MIDLIIPAYNAHDFISDLLFSVASQTISDKINVIIVDDCSKKDYKDKEIRQWPIIPEQKS